MFSKTTLKALGLAALFFSQSSLANPVTDTVPPGAFGQLNRDAKARRPSVDTAKHPLVDAAKTKTDATTFRYLNSQTAPYQVTALPSIPFDVGEMYSGLIPIKSGDTSRELFFIFQPTTGPPVNTLTIWFNGGPGCSSLNGFLEENGRFVWIPGSSGPVVNPYAWTNLTNVLWIEQPVGTGFSTGTPTATTETAIASDVLGFLQNFETLFSISNYQIYVTGESYAGRYVPYVSAAMLNKKDTTHFNLAGTIIYDGCIGQFDVVQEDMVVYPFIKANPQYFGLSSSQLNSLKNSHTSCGFDTAINKYLKFPPPGHMPSMKQTSSCALFNKAYNYALEANSCFNVYEVNQTCPTPSDPLGDSSPYFNRADVKAAIHAPSSITWSECSNDAVFVGRGGPENEGDLSPNPSDSVLPQVIAATNRTLIANGDLDMIIITNGSLLAIQNMTWGGAQGFQTKPVTPIMISGVNKGIQHFERGLLWTEMYLDGHMGPQYQPAVSFRQLQWVLGQIETI